MNRICISAVDGGSGRAPRPSEGALRSTSAARIAKGELR
jgi:hypothetical protein